MVITAHWVDDEWNLQKKILNFFQTPDHNGETIAKGIEACLLDWGIENIFTVTLDNAGVNDAAIKYLKRRIEDWEGCILGNELLHVRCNAHILNLIVIEGLSEQNESISRVRNAVKYVKSSPAIFSSFKSFVEKVKIDTHGLLSLDVETRWNSTYMMLDTTVKFEMAFSRMYDDDHKYLKYCLESGTVRHLSIDDWKNVKGFIKFLEIFYHVTLKFSGTSYVTSNCFFHELFNLQNIILKYSLSKDSILSGMAEKMKAEFIKYWGTFESMNKLLFVAVVLDPRCKLRYVNFLFNKSKGCSEGTEKSNKVMDTWTRLYDHYKNSLGGTSNENIGVQNYLTDEIDVMNSGEMWQSQWEKYLEDKVNVETKSELEKYLTDDLDMTNDLNILTWWKVSSNRYPIVSRIAKEVLSVYISTVAFESTFSTGGRIHDSYRSSLSINIVEALICTQQWIRSGFKECKLEDLIEIQKLKIVEKSMLPQL